MERAALLPAAVRVRPPLGNLLRVTPADAWQQTQQLTWAPDPRRHSVAAPQAARGSILATRAALAIGVWTGAWALEQRRSLGRGRRLRCKRGRTATVWGSGACAASLVEREPQILSLTHAESGSEVVLVACMHFNPRSVAKAADVTRRLLDKNALAAVVVESCPTRWEKVQLLQPPGSPLRMVLDNEMQAAAEEASAAGQKVILGDQRIEDLADEVGALGRTALLDLVSPFNGGWQRTATDLVAGVRRLGDAGTRKRDSSAADAPSSVASEQEENASIGIFDVLDPLLVVGAPIAIFRYCLSTLIRAPKLFAAVFGSLGLFAVLPDSQLSDFLAILFDVVFLRVLLGAMLRDRDAVLARSIAETCRSASGRGRAVVAVLGAAHCNGVKRHLLDSGFS